MTGIFVLLLSACATSGPLAEPPSALGDPAPSPSAPLQDISLYDLEATLTDQHGRAVSLDLARGQPTLVSMFYTTCPAACPMLIAAIRAIEDQLTPARRAELRVVLVSFDPARDTPAVLLQTSVDRGLDARWHLLTTDAAQVRTIAAALGFQVRRREDGEFDHSSVLTLLDGDGVILAQLPSASASPAPILAALDTGALQP